jgi:L-rhamnose-H+ transport protein
MIVGLMLLVLAGLMNGSFATPMKYIQGWQWEHSWLIWSFTGLIVVPMAVALATVAHPWQVYAGAPLGSVLLVVVLGLLWGVSAILFGLGVSRLGLAIGFGVILGISAALGGLIPLLVLHPESLLRPAGLLTMAGVVLLVSGVTCCAIAGRIRDASGAVTRTGLVICILSGVGAPMINFGLAFGSGIVARAKETGTAAAHSVNAIWPLLLGGAFLVNAGYCVYLMRRKSGFEVFRQPRALLNLGLGSVMGMLWMGSNMAYGYGSTHLGPLGLAVGWPIMMGCVVLTANGWGLATGEWRGASARAKAWIAAGVLALIAGVAVTGSAGGH